MHRLIDIPGFHDTQEIPDLEVDQELLRWLPQVDCQQVLIRPLCGLELTITVPRSLIPKANAQGSNGNFGNQPRDTAQALKRRHTHRGDHGQDHRG